MILSTLFQRLGTGLLGAALALTLSLGAVACSDDNDNKSAAPGATSAPTAAASTSATTVPILTAPTSSANPNKITIQNFTFMGLDAAKANVTWSITNQDSVVHTVSADDGSFVWRVEAGQTAPFAKTLAPGSYPVHCDIHPARMKGVLVVK